MMENMPFNEKRIFPRFTINIPLTFCELRSNTSFAGQTHDISTQGVCMLTERKVSSGSDLDLSLKMVDNNERIYVKGKVVWSCMLDSGKYKIGIQLEEPRLKPIPLVLRTIMAQRKH